MPCCILILEKTHPWPSAGTEVVCSNSLQWLVQLSQLGLKLLTYSKLRICQVPAPSAVLLSFAIARSWRRIGWLHSGGFDVPKSLARNIKECWTNWLQWPKWPAIILQSHFLLQERRLEQESEEAFRGIAEICRMQDPSPFDQHEPLVVQVAFAACRLLTSWRPWMQQWLAKKSGQSGSMSQYSQFRSTTSSCTRQNKM